MPQYEYKSISMTEWENTYRRLGLLGWTPVYVPSPRVWLVREIPPEMETKDVLRGVYANKPVESIPASEPEEKSKVEDPRLKKLSMDEQVAWLEEHTASHDIPNEDCPYCQKEKVLREWFLQKQRARQRA